MSQVKKEVLQEIEKTVKNNDVVLYMKGSKDFPQCGFSATTCHILSRIGVNFLDINVLEDDAVRAAIKEYSDWPTIPQLYVKGEFLGGCDIVREMSETGELETLLKEKSII